VPTLSWTRTCRPSEVVVGACQGAADGAGVEADEVGDMLNPRKTNIGLEANALDHKGSRRRTG
jgi:hypothetical protein